MSEATRLPEAISTSATAASSTTVTTTVTAAAGDAVRPDAHRTG
ncbi:MAG: hypothetical protein WBO08_07400 [Mycobacterium sp.]